MYTSAQEAAWLRACQIPAGHPGAGALCMAPSRDRCVPYFAAIALTAALPEPGMLPVAGAYLAWHVAHMRPDGRIDDWRFDATAEYSTGRRDSEDAYAATFLTLARAYSTQVGLAWARANLTALRRSAAVIERLRSSDGLTWAKRTWPVKFTMDNCEVYRGLHDWAHLLADLGEPDAADAADRAESTRQAVLGHLYDRHRQSFYYARLPLGAHAGPNWLRWIEAAAEQFPLLLGVLHARDPLARVLYERLCLAFPAWDRGETGDPFPWLVIGSAAAGLGDEERALSLLFYAENHHIGAGRRYWYCTESGYYLALRRRLGLY